jgi:RNA polymerase sigma-70 factor (ECF subfamily)
VDHKIDLAAVLQHLSPPHREVIVLRELQGMTYEEIAQSLGIPRGTVESRLHRARLDLQQRLKGYFS